MDFEMIVDEVFVFKGGQTVFAGQVLTGPSFINACTCDLYSNEVKVVTFDLEGEMVPLRKTKNKARAVSTFHPFLKEELHDLPNLKIVECQKTSN